MFLIILLIYFIILIFLEIIFIISSRYKNKTQELYNIIEKDEDKDKDKDKEINKTIDEEMILNTSKYDLDIKNYVGKFYIKNYYGFFINLDTWNLLKADKIYQFNVPVNIKILKLKEKDDIKYYINK